MAIKTVKAETMQGFVGITPLGLYGFHGSGYAAVDEGLVKIHAVQMRSHTPI